MFVRAKDVARDAPVLVTAAPLILHSLAVPLCPQNSCRLRAAFARTSYFAGFNFHSSSTMNNTPR